MSSGRKRKYGTISEPSEDELNNSIQMLNNKSVLSVDNFDDESESDVNWDSNFENKIFSDPVHGHFQLPVLLLKIIDTPAFQRLRYIRQMGCSYFVHLGASHTRFEHCLGVAYLAGKVCKVLQKRQPELRITKKDILCLQIAGLCHDIGHGPFSHFFDKVFIPMVKPGISWSHEQGSIDMFNHMLKENDLESILMDNGLNGQDILFIKELLGDHSAKRSSSEEWSYRGRSKSKSFLYEVILNKSSGIDVDKWDYLARDGYYIGLTNSFDYRRFLKFVRVISVDGKLQICTRDKEAGTLYEMFHVRSNLQRANQHKTILAVDAMLGEALMKANDHINIPGKDRKMLKIADCIHDMHAFTKLTDNILIMIETSQDKNLKEAQQILKRLHSRDHYKLVCQRILKGQVCKCETELRDDIVKEMDSTIANKDDFVVKIAKFNYGKKDKNPVEYARFYKKDKPDIAIKLKRKQVSHMLPEVFNEQHIILYCKKKDPFLIQHALIAFNTWCGSKLGIPIDEDCAAGGSHSSKM